MTPDLHGYRWVLVSISGGKDSQTALRRIVAEAERQGYPRERIVTTFADLGERDEWPATADLGAHLVTLYGDRPSAADLAERHAAHYRLRHIVTRRVTKDGEVQDLLDHIEQRGMWPSSAARYCTSDMKRGPVYRVMTQLAAEARQDGHSGPVHVLSVMGMRAAESPARAKLAPFKREPKPTGEGTVKVVDTWLPIHGMTTAEVWADVKASQVPYHWVYDAALPRLSCRFCVLAGQHALALAAQLDPDGAFERLAAEDRMGHLFKSKTSGMAKVIELAMERPPLAVVDPAAPNPLAWVG